MAPSPARAHARRPPHDAGLRVRAAFRFRWPRRRWPHRRLRGLVDGFVGDLVGVGVVGVGHVGGVIGGHGTNSTFAILIWPPSRWRLTDSRQVARLLLGACGVGDARRGRHQHDGRIVGHRFDGGGVDGDLGDHLRVLRHLDEVVRLVLEVVLELARGVVDDALYVFLRLVEVQRHQRHDALPCRPRRTRRCAAVRRPDRGGAITMSTLSVINAIVQRMARVVATTLSTGRAASGVARGPALPRRLLGDIFVRRPGSLRRSILDSACVDLGRRRHVGFGVDGFDSIVASAVSACLRKPNRAGSGTRGGSHRLRLGRLCLGFLREGKCVCRIGRPIRILRRFDRRGQRRSPTRGA